jgi:Transposase DDE domain
MKANQTDSWGWDEALAMFGGEDALLASAFEHKALLRKREVKRAGDLLRLALMYGPGGHSLRMAAALAEAAAVARLSDVALMKRVSGAADWLEALCNDRLLQVHQSAPPRQQGAAAHIRIRDATVIPAQGQGLSYMVHLSYDPGSSRIVDLTVTPRPLAEDLTRLEPESGDLVIADRAYPTPDSIRSLREKGCELLLRLSWRRLRLQDADGQIIDWHELLRLAKTTVVDKPVFIVRPNGTFKPVPMRLVLLPKPEEAAIKAREKVKREAARRQSKWQDPRTKDAADCLILLTSLSPEQASPERLRELYAVRWQIELAFKRLKSILDMAKLPVKNPKLARAWLYAHLLLALLADDIRTTADAIPP